MSKPSYVPLQLRIKNKSTGQFLEVSEDSEEMAKAVLTSENNKSLGYWNVTKSEMEPSGQYVVTELDEITKPCAQNSPGTIEQTKKCPLILTFISEQYVDPNHRPGWRVHKSYRLEAIPSTDAKTAELSCVSRQQRFETPAPKHETPKTSEYETFEYETRETLKKYETTVETEETSPQASALDENWTNQSWIFDEGKLKSARGKLLICATENGPALADAGTLLNEDWELEEIPFQEDI